MGGLLFETLIGLGTSLVSLVNVLLKNYLALDCLLAEQGRVVS